MTGHISACLDTAGLIPPYVSAQDAEVTVHKASMFVSLLFQLFPQYIVDFL